MGLAYLAAVLQADGMDVAIVDANALGLSPQECAEQALRLEPDICGFTASTPTVHLCADIGRRLRAGGFTGHLVVGGPHPTALASECVREFGFDVAVKGEGEGRVVDIVSRLRAGDSLETIPGLAFKTACGVVDTGPIPAPPDLDTLPRPARALLPMTRYRGPDGPNATTVIASRGCSAPCTYCAVPAHFGHRIRRRDPADVVAEVAELNADWGTTWVNFIDDTFTWNERWVREVCDQFDEAGLSNRVRWQCLTRVDRVSEELLRRMKRSGCARIELGIECASPTGRSALRKGIHDGQILEAFGWARAAGLETLAFAMVNVPDETLADIDATAALIDEVDPDYLQLSYCTPYPGTPLYDWAKAEERLRSEDWRDYRFLRFPVLDNGVLSVAEVERSHTRFMRRFWLRPKRLLRIGRRLLVQPDARRAVLAAGLNATGRLVRQGRASRRS